MIDKSAGGRPGDAEAKKPKAKPSIFASSEDNMKKFSQLRKLVETEFPDITEAQLEERIKRQDARVKYLILKNFKNARRQKPFSEKSQQQLESLVVFARLNDLPKEFFTFPPLSQYHASQVDRAIQQMYQRQPLAIIQQDTHVDLLNLELLKECSELASGGDRGDGNPPI
jgi:hypothetical protein